MIYDRIPITYEEVCRRLDKKLGVSIPRKIKRKRWLGETRYWGWSVEEYISEQWRKSVKERTFVKGVPTEKQRTDTKFVGGVLSRKEHELEQRVHQIIK